MRISRPFSAEKGTFHTKIGEEILVLALGEGPKTSEIKSPLCRAKDFLWKVCGNSAETSRKLKNV